MCSYSAVIDTWREGWHPYIHPPTVPTSPYQPVPTITYPALDQAERDRLKKEIAEFRKLLEKARKWDKEHVAEPCVETPQKIEALMEIVRALGLEDEVEIVLKETEEDDDNAETQDWGTTPTYIREVLRSGSSSGTSTFDDITVSVT